MQRVSRTRAGEKGRLEPRDVRKGFNTYAEGIGRVQQNRGEQCARQTTHLITSPALYLRIAICASEMFCAAVVPYTCHHHGMPRAHGAKAAALAALK